MQIQTLIYTKQKGWDSVGFPSLDSENTLIIVFASPSMRNEAQAISELHQAYPKSKMLGCSTAGEILGSVIYDDCFVVAITKFERTKIKLVKTSLKGMEESFTAGQSIAKELNSDDLSGIFVLSDGLNVNGSELVSGMNKSSNTIVTGGLAGDGKDFKSTWEIYNGEIISNSVVAVGFYGSNIKIGHASRGGWDIFGPERLVTRSNANVLYELDGKPALELYKEYLGERADELPASGLLYPLSIRKERDDAKQLVRTILAIDDKTQSLIFAGDIPKGYLAQLMRANFDRLITSASEAADVALDIMSKKDMTKDLPILSIAISCVGRRLLLGERTEEETESLLDAFPKGTQQVGFYSYGEISPYSVGNCDLHNQTMTLTTICET